MNAAMLRIVVLGSSFDGLTTAFKLRAKITVISDENQFVFLPSLPWLIMSWRKPEDITLNVDKILKSKGITFIHEPAKQVYPDSSKITLFASPDYLHSFLAVFQGLVDSFLSQLLI